MPVDLRGLKRRGAICLLVVLCVIMTAGGCAQPYKVAERYLRVRYVSVSLVFEYVVQNDEEARSLRKSMKETASRLKKLEERLRSGSDPAPKAVQEADIGRTRKTLKAFEEKEGNIKRRILNDINRAIGQVADKNHVDYVFNLGDALVYSKKEYDITEDVLKEIMKFKKRNAPVSR